MRLLTISNPKTIKGMKRGWLTGVLHLAPARNAGRHINVCPWASRGCSRACLYTAGRGGAFPSIPRARIRKTRWLYVDRRGFLEQLHRDIDSLARRAKRLGLQPAVRLNATSDLPWETKAFGQVPQHHSGVTHYDYTRSIRRLLRDKPPNYSLLFSRGEHNEQVCRRALAAGYNVAVVFDEVPAGDTYLGYPVIDGDQDDLKFLDERPRVVGLYAKGRARRDHSGFVVRLNQIQERAGR
jgi:hypothetical protein